MPVESDKIEYDEKNPAKTIAELAGVDEREIEEILTHLTLTEYVAIVTAIQNKDDSQITDIIDKNIEKQASVEEALDFNTKAELQKMAPRLPKGTSKPKSVNMPNKPTSPKTPSSLTNTTSISTTGTKTTTGSIAPTTTTSVTSDDISIVSADSKTNTIAIKDPKNQNKVSMVSIKDPNNTEEIKDLMKRSGITGLV